MILVRALLFTIAAMILNVAAAFLWVWLYSILIAPGHDEAHYQAYAMRAAPISSIVAGAPILFAAAWLAGRRDAAQPVLAGALVGLCYVAIDAAILVAAGATIPIAIVALSFATKIVASWAGGVLAARRSSA